MRNHLLFITLLASLTANTSCVQTECGDGTIERDGQCVAANVNKDPADCGPFTKLQGDICVPELPPTECDPTTSMATIDPMTGVTICVGTGGGGCSATFACPQPVGSTKLTICGQLYDYENMSKFAGDATGARCDSSSPSTTGPCALTVLAFDALVYGNDQTKGNVTPTGPDDIYIDDCGRFRVSNIETNGTGPFIGLGFTEAGKLPQRPLDQLTVTATTGVATLKPSNRVVTKLEAYVAKPALIKGWQDSGGPPLSGGIYVGIFRQHKTPTGTGSQDPTQAGVKFTKNNSPIMSQDYYFQAAQATNTTIDINATATGVNGSGFLTGTSVNDATAYSGTGGITDTTHCTWENHAAANLANIVFFQIYRKADVPLQADPCTE
jgi:hypothetical protein